MGVKIGIWRDGTENIQYVQTQIPIGGGLRGEGEG
jgi:hypothetical protein